MPDALLRLEGLSVAYGGIRAVKNIDLEVAEGEFVTLIGANGAGKSSTLLAVAGLVIPSQGRICLDGQALTPGRAQDLPGRGLALVPEGRGVFARMSILENLHMGAFARKDKGQIAADLERVFGLFPRLRERAGQLAGTLSGGEQQMLAMARALMSRPRLLLLDEPSMGLAPVMVERIFEVIREVAAQGTTLLLVEQNARLALQCASRAYVMESGEITLTGPAHELLDDPRVRSAYLGE